MIFHQYRNPDEGAEAFLIHDDADEDHDVIVTLQYPTGRGQEALRVLRGAHLSGPMIAQAMFMVGDASVSAVAQDELAEMLNPTPVEAPADDDDDKREA